MQFDPQTPQPAVSRATTFDAGLRAHFQSVYSTMALGLAATGAVAFAVSHNAALVHALFGTPLAFLVMFAPMLFIFFGFTPNAVRRKSASQLTILFYAFSAVFGVSMATIFLAYAGTSVARVFFITAGMFAATSIYGYQTKTDLSGLRGMLVMGVIGLFIAMMVNIFLKSSMLDFVISGIGVLVYTGLVAWDTQNIKESYSASYGQEDNRKAAILGALSLYINFIMLFQFLLSLSGGRR